MTSEQTTLIAERKLVLTKQKQRRCCIKLCFIDNRCNHLGFHILIIFMLLICILPFKPSLAFPTRTLDSIYNSGEKKNESLKICTTQQCFKYSDELVRSMNEKVNPCDNFYEYVCGNWNIEHGQSINSWNQFQSISQLIKTRLKTQRNLKGYQSLFKKIQHIGGWPMIEGNKWDNASFQWEKTFVSLSKLNIFYLLSVERMIDFRNTSQTIIKIGPPYLTTENTINFNREKFDEKDSEKDNQFKDLYKNIIMDELKPHLPAEQASRINQSTLIYEIDEIYELQEKLEKKTGPIHPVFYYQKHYEQHLVNMSQIKSQVTYDIDYILQKIFNKKIHDDEKIFLPDPNYLIQMGQLIESTEKRTLANYFAANMVYQMAKFTTESMMKKLVTKSINEQTLSNLCYEETESFLPELLGKLYLDVYFDGRIKQNIQLMASLLKISFKQNFQQNSKWMDGSTTKQAIDKLNQMAINIAYPQWYDNETLFQSFVYSWGRIEAGDYFQSVINVIEARQNSLMNLSQNFLSSLNKSHSWPRKQMTDVNAFYYFSTNGVYIPAGILANQTTANNLSSAISFGSIGMILGHEMAHAFDETGRLYDGMGALRNWWTNETQNLFNEKSQCFVNQYNAYKMGKHNIDGQQTLAENIADNSGLHEAYRAFKLHQNEKSEENMRLPNQMSKFTTDQLFFISFAHMWCTKMDEAAITNSVENSVHSPPPIRVKGSLDNSQAFSRAFDCPLNSKMNPPHKCILW